MSSFEKNVWTMASQARETIIDHTVDNYPHEACGILLCPIEKPLYISMAQPTINVTQEDPKRRYLIDPAEFIAVDRWAEQRGLDISGFYHSHPDHPAAPSDHDRSLAWEGYLYLIVSVKKGRFDAAGAWTYDQNQNMFNEAIIQFTYEKNEAAMIKPRS